MIHVHDMYMYTTIRKPHNAHHRMSRLDQSLSFDHLHPLSDFLSPFPKGLSVWMDSITWIPSSWILVVLGP